MKRILHHSCILRVGAISALALMASSCGPDGSGISQAAGGQSLTPLQVVEADEDDAATPLRTTAAVRQANPPQNFTASAGTDGPVLRWDKSGRADIYVVWRAKVPARYRALREIKFDRVAATRDLEFTDTSAEVGVDYMYRVTARNEAGLSRPSEKSCSWRPPEGGEQTYTGKRPRVYVSIHGASNLGTQSAAERQQWNYVRMCLDGFYGNMSGVTEQEAYDLITRTHTRNLVGIINLNNFISTGQSPQREGGVALDATTELRPINRFTRLDRQFPDLNMQRKHMVAYTLFPQVWDMVSYNDLVTEYVNNPEIGPDREGWLFDSIYMGTAIRSWDDPKARFELTEKPSPQDPTSGALSTVRAQNMFDRSAGHMIECIGGHCRGGGDRAQAFSDLVRRVHDDGKPMMVFLSHVNAERTNWNTNMQQLFNQNREAWQDDDIFMLVNYFDRYQLLPEKNPDGTAANTLTGNLYWLLHQ